MMLIWRIWAPSASLRVSRISHSLGAGSPLDGCARTNAYAEFDEITARKLREDDPEIR
jgi:hypothetical protein